MTHVMDRKQTIEHIKGMTDPVVVVDTSSGSAIAKFLVVDIDDPMWALDQSPEITRFEFNDMRSSGILDGNLENRVKVDNIFAYRFRTGDHDGSEQKV